VHTLKIQAQKQWNTDACGAEAAAHLEEGSSAFFEAVRRHRYVEYAPWIPAAVEFERFRGKRVLEIGPGLGTDLLQFASHGAQSFAVDLAQRHIELTRRNLGIHGYVAPCLLGDAEALPFREDTFDCVYAFGVLHHTPTIDRAIREIHRVLKIGGKAVVALYHRDSAFYWVYTILFRGVGKMELIRKGYRRFMSEIEFRSENSEAMPLVRVYSRNQVRRLFRGFRTTKIQTRHLEFSHLVLADRMMKAWPGLRPGRDFVERFARYLGWYLIIEVDK
jgi:SAM-dependent methyltransferase